MWSVLHEPDFLKLWSANLIASFGGQALGLALGVYVYQLTGSALASGLMLVAGTLPGLLLGSVGGTVADRLDRRGLMLAVNTLRALLVASLLLVRGLEGLWWVYAVAFLQSVLMQFFMPAEQALIPTLVPKERLLQANALNTLAVQGVRLTASVSGGALMVLLGFGPVALLGAAGFALSALLIGGIRPRSRAEGSRPEHTPFGVAWREGWVELRRNRTARALTVVTGLDALKEGALGALFAAFTLGVLGVSAQQMGLINSIQALGGLLAGALVPRLVTRFSPRVVVAWGLTLNGLCLWGMAAFPSLALTLFLFCITGFPATAAYVTAGTLIQQSVQGERRGRVFGVQAVAGSAGFLVSALLGSWLGDRLGVAPVLAAFVLFDVLAGAVAWAMLPPSSTVSAHSAPGKIG